MNKMASGYMEKLLFVNLSTGEIREEPLDENICRNYIGGNGIGARMLYSLQKAESTHWDRKICWGY